MIVSPAGDYETQESWDESPSPNEFYSRYPSGDPVGSSEDDDDEEEEDPHYEPVKLKMMVVSINYTSFSFRLSLYSTMTDYPACTFFVRICVPILCDYDLCGHVWNYGVFFHFSPPPPQSLDTILC